MARGWHYTKLSLSNALLYLSGICFVYLFLIYFCFVFVLFLFCFVSMLSLELCRCSSDLSLPSRLRTGLATPYVYYWVWLRPNRLM